MDMQHADEESIVRHMAELIVNIHRCAPGPLQHPLFVNATLRLLACVSRGLAE